MPRSHILSNVDCVFNAVNVTGDAVGDVVFYGKGAGKMATASAVVADMIDCAKHPDTTMYRFWEGEGSDLVVTPDESEQLYVLAKSENYSELESSVAELFPEAQCVKNSIKGEIALITELDNLSRLEDKIKLIKANDIKVLHTLV